MHIEDVAITPIAIKDPPLLNLAGVHQTHALHSTLKVTTSHGLIGCGSGMSWLQH